MVTVIAAIGAALVTILWTTQASVVDARATMLRGMAAEAGNTLRLRLMELEGETPEARVKAAVESTAAQHVRYLAIFENGKLVAQAGRSSASVAQLEAWFATAEPGQPVEAGDRVRIAFRRPPRASAPPPGPNGRRPSEILIELDTARVDDLDASATLALGLGIAAATALIALTLVLVRWSLRREAAVRAAEQARHLAHLGQMSAVLAHEIRNPLASLKGNAQLLAQTLPAGERPRAKADRVVDEAIRLEHLTNDLLEFARSGEIKIAPAEPGALLRSAATAVSAARIEVIDADAPRTWPLDADRMRQVLINLLENATEMSEQPVTATVTRAGLGLRFVVRDRGAGIAEGDLAQVFEPFFTRRTRGTGLGLAVSKRLVELHGGTLVARNADGGGAEFTIELPREVP